MHEAAEQICFVALGACQRSNFLTVERHPLLPIMTGSIRQPCSDSSHLGGVAGLVLSHEQNPLVEIEHAEERVGVCELPQCQPVPLACGVHEVMTRTVQGEQS